MYSARVLADSVSLHGVRLTTLEVVFPRFILAEVNTHRMLSRNSASSRAIPTEKLIERVRTDPFIPEFNQRVKGMGVGEPLSAEERAQAVEDWLHVRNTALGAAQRLLHVDKSRVNRLLEPFMWHTALITATEWDNFFALRTAPDAQPEFRKIALMMKEAMYEHKPTILLHGQWHLPLLNNEERREALYNPPKWKKISTGRCARVSYLTHDGVRDLQADIDLHDSLKKRGHMSPFEHVARPLHWTDINDVDENHLCSQDWSGNFRGWSQYRKEIPNEHNFGLVDNDRMDVLS